MASVQGTNINETLLTALMLSNEFDIASGQIIIFQSVAVAELGIKDRDLMMKIPFSILVVFNVVLYSS